MLDFLFPKYLNCILCGKPMYKDQWLCDVCQSTLQYQQGHTCRYCGRMLVKGTHPVCDVCKALDKYFLGGSSSLVYDERAKAIIKSYKYHQKKYLSDYMTDLMAKSFYEHFGHIKFTGMTFVPTHHDKLKEKKWCPAQVLAEDLSKKLKIKLIDLLSRTRNTPPLNAYPLDERYDILKDAFKAEACMGTYLLIDDIMTSGNTLNECAKALISKGASGVYILTFAASE